MIIVLNGPLGVGKSTLAEALTESIHGCVNLDGDGLVAANPPPVDDVEHLHAGIALMVAHHRGFGYRHFVIDHLWTSAEELSDLRRRLLEIDPGAEIRVFLLGLPLEENLRRIERRAEARALDELDFERRTVAEERDALAGAPEGALGEALDASGSPETLVREVLRRVGGAP